MGDSTRVIDVETDITAKELEGLINDAEAGTTLKLASGNFTFDDAITIRRSDISLIGAGSDETTLTFSDEALERNDDYAIRLDGSENTTVGRLDDGIEAGSTQLDIDTAHGLKAGDTVRLWQDNDDDFFDEIGDSSWRKVEYAELRTSMAKVTSVEGSTVNLDRGVHFDFDGGETQVERLDTVDDVTLQGFSVGFELGSPDNTDFDNTLHDLRGYHAVSLDGTVNSALSDIQVIDGPSLAFRFSKTLDSDVERIEAHGAFNKGSGGNGYAYELHESYDGTFSHLQDTGMRHGLLFASWRSSVNNEVQVDFTDRDINFHGGRDHGNRVHVEQSIRDPEADDLSPTLWVNSGGEDFGAVTDADANDVTFDYVVGSRRDDTIQGTDAGVYLNGGLGHDTLIGGSGDDLLQGGPGDDWYDGNDTLDGGQGHDTALYPQDYADYEIAFDGDQVIIEGKGGKDVLDNIESVLFGDGTVLDTDSRDTAQGAVFSTPSPDDILVDDADDGEESTAPADVSVTGNTTSTWSSGYVAEVFVENTSDGDIVDPAVQFDLPADIDTLWNGRVTGDDGSYRVTDDNSNVLTPGEVWRFAYKAYGDDQALPSQVSVQDSGSGELSAQVLGVKDTPGGDVPA